MLTPHTFGERKHRRELKRKRYRITLKGIKRTEAEHNRVKYRGGLPYQKAPIFMVDIHKKAVAARVKKQIESAQEAAKGRKGVKRYG